MKRYATTLSNGHRIETSSCHEAQNIQNYDNQQTFELAGKLVTAVEFFAAARTAVDAAWAKKEQTHRRARVRHGSSAGCYVEKWVRR